MVVHHFKLFNDRYIKVNVLIAFHNTIIHVSTYAWPIMVKPRADGTYIFAIGLSAFNLLEL